MRANSLKKRCPALWFHNHSWRAVMYLSVRRMFIFDPAQGRIKKPRGQWRSKGILRPGANKNFAPPVLYNSMIICTSRFVLSSYIGRLSFCIATTFKIFFHKFSRFIQKRFKLGSPFSTLSSTLFFWHNLPSS